MKHIKMSEVAVYPAVKSGLLIINPDGTIWRTKPEFVRAENRNGSGYLQVRVMREKVRHHALAHRLVFHHFKGPIPEGLTVNHKDGNKANNHPDNLELATYSEQQIHATRILKRGHACMQHGEQNNMAKLTSVQILEIRQRRLSGEPLKKIAADFGTTDRNVSRIALGHRWQSIK